jgi:hypothetical protein
MDFLRFANWGSVSEGGYARRAAPAFSDTDFVDLDAVLQDAHLRRDIARRADLSPFVRDEHSRAA